MTANPKKAAFLGLLLVVAMYYWAPLVWGWIGPANSHAKEAKAALGQEIPSPNATGAVPSPGSTGDPNTTTQGKKPTPDRSWDELVRCIEQDPRMKPAGGLASSRDPFHPVVREVAEKPKNDEMKAAEAAATMTPEKLGLVLSSTVIAPRRRTALVNGRAYEQGQTIHAAKDGRQYEFTLSEVHPRRIVLKREDRQYELAIPRPASTGRLEMYGSTK